MLPVMKNTRTPGRPTSVTLIAWFLICFGAFQVLWFAIELVGTSLIASQDIAQSTESLPIQYAVSIIHPFIALICGYFLLRGKNWSRYLYGIGSTLLLIYGFAISPMRLIMIPGVVLLLLSVCFLFRPQANAFFATGGANLSPPSARSVLSACCYLLAGFCLNVTCIVSFFLIPADPTKWFFLSLLLLPALVLLSIGGILSPACCWMREVGIVLLASAASGALMMLMMALMFMEPEFQQSFSSGELEFFGSFFAGILWVALLSTLGILFLLAARREAAAAHAKPHIPKVPGI